LPTAPTRAGYTFAAWYSNSGLTTLFDFDTAITVDTPLYAKWTANSFTEVTIASPSARHIVQRSSGNTGSIPISGTYAGAPQRIEARVVVMSGSGNSGTSSTEWQTITSSPSGGTFSGTLTGVAAGGWYQLEVRAVTNDTPDTAAVLEKVGVGDIYVTAGQSNSANFGTQATPTDDRVSTRTSLTASTWRHAYDPQPLADGGYGSVWSRLGDQLAAANNVPIGFVCVGVGATQLSQWVPGTTYYNDRLKPAILSFGVSGFRAVLWHQGESDSLANVTANDHAASLLSMIGQTRTDAGWQVPWYVAEASFHPSSTLSQEEPICAGQRGAAYGGTNIFLGPSTDGFHLEDASGGKLIDTVHFNAAGMLDHATQWCAILRGTTSVTPRNGDFEDNRNAAITGLSALADNARHVVNTSSDQDSPSVLGWRILSSSGVNAADGNNGFHNPSTDTYSGAVDTTNNGVLTGMSGRHVAMLEGGNAGNYFLHTTRAMAAANTAHTLTVAIGVRDSSASFGGVQLDILAKGVVVATRTLNKAAMDTLRGSESAGAFTDVSLVYQSGGSVSANQPLAIRIAKVGGAGTVLDFDNVRLATASSGVSYTLTYSAGSNGSITGTAEQSVASGGSGTQVTATPNSGYQFVKWSDDSTANPRTDTNVTSNISVTASFELLPAGTVTPDSTVTRADGKVVATFSTVGTGSWTIPEGASAIEVLVVGGGGGGGITLYGGGGGGGGAYYNSASSLTGGSSVTVTVGAGGTGGVAGVTGKGGNSVLGTVTAYGGLAGASGLGGTSGANSLSVGIPNGSGTGFAGGLGFNDAGGAGGGAGVAAQAGWDKNGGNGLSFSITGTSVYYGGGGAAIAVSASADGGLGGGGNGGGDPTPAPTAGTNGLGGGGAGRAHAGAAGGSGVVIVAYRIQSNQSYQSWLSDNSLTASDANLQAYAFGTTPGGSSSDPITYVVDGAVSSPGQPTTRITKHATSADYQAVFGRRLNYAAAGLTYTVQFSAGLDVWVDSTVTPTVLATDGTIQAVSVPYPAFIPTSKDSEGNDQYEKPTFFRVKIEIH
jgi:uncharacterized repeat protein (TIGR02543 family)